MPTEKELYEQQIDEILATLRENALGKFAAAKSASPENFYPKNSYHMTKAVILSETKTFLEPRTYSDDYENIHACI